MKHHPDCDVNDANIEGIRKPCNCGAISSAEGPSEKQPHSGALGVIGGSALKVEISKVLQAALSGSDKSLRHEERFIRWGLVEKRIHDLIDAATTAQNTQSSATPNHGH